MPTTKTLAAGAVTGLLVIPVAFLGVSAVADTHRPAQPAITIPEPTPTPTASATPTGDPGLLPVFLAHPDGAQWEGTVTSLEAEGGDKGGADGYTAVADIPLYDLAVFDLCEDISTVFNGGDITVLDPAGTELAFPGTDGICLLAGTVKEYPIEVDPPVARPDTVPITDPLPTVTEPTSAPPTPEDRPAPQYENCTAVWEATGGPIRQGDPGYAPHLDKGGVPGVGCEQDPR